MKAGRILCGICAGERATPHPPGTAPPGMHTTTPNRTYRLRLNSLVISHESAFLRRISPGEASPRRLTRLVGRTGRHG